MKVNKLLLIILFLGLFLRTYNAGEWFPYSHDHDLLGWFIRDVVLNGDLRLIGQETSQHGVFIGPLFYYAVIPFYLLANWDPIGGVLLVAALGVFGVWSIWYVTKKIFSEKAGFIAALIYSTSYSIVLTDREVVPTMPVVIWTIWFLYLLYLVLNNKQNASWPLAGILLGLIWHLNMGLILLSPLILIAFVLSRKKLQLKPLIIGIGISVALMLPFILFEIRHGFIQINAIFSSGTDSTVSILNKFDRVLQLIGKNIYRLYFAEAIPIRHLYVIVLALLGLIFSFSKKLITKKMAVLLVIWILLYLLFFSLNSINVSEYYLNGLNIIWILIPTLVIEYLWYKKGIFKYVGISIFAGIVLANLYRFTIHETSGAGYVERKAIIQEIKRDADEKGYECVSLSFITSPGNDLGYRYFTWLSKLKTKSVGEQIPVYSIVFPHRFVDHIDKSFGSLGLIYPEYERYNNQQISKSCEGEDFNTTYPLFGYTE